MTPPDRAPPDLDAEFLDRLRAALQADEDDEAVLGWMVEEIYVSADDLVRSRALAGMPQPPPRSAPPTLPQR